MRLYRCLIFILLPVSILTAQPGPPTVALPGRVIATPAGLLLSTEGGDALFAFDQSSGGVTPLIRGAGSARFAAASPDGMRIGFKLFGPGGMQAPALLDRSTGTYTTLVPPDLRTGEVSFARNGSVAFTLGDALVVREARGAERRYDLGNYANLAPISPDGLRAAFNDAQDRIWILELATKARIQVSPGAAGFFHPQWSPDGSKLLMSRLDGEAVIYSPGSGTIAHLGEAHTPVWSPDGQYVAFVRRDVRQGTLIGSEAYLYSRESGAISPLTATPEFYEADPSFSVDGATLFCHGEGESRVTAIPLLSSGAQVLPGLKSEIPVTLGPPPGTLPSLGKADAAAWLDIPYVNQVYDTPDWFNGHAACGPTTSAMLLAYWNILPEWPTSCSTPTYHVNLWGNYVSERYNFRGFDYSYPANDPNERPAYGGFGYMWNGASPHSRMANYYSQHGMPALTTDTPGHDSVVAWINRAPVSLCNGLTTAGHIVLVHGIDVEPHTFIVNDPYGDKNRTDLGYPNTLGKNAKYDWPGYNNGNKNFSTVYWTVTATRPDISQPDTLVDDLQFQRGFYLHNRPPAGMASWKTLRRGYNNHLWFAYTKLGPADTCYAIWTPNLPQEGNYEISAFISISNATAATYKINTLDGVQSVVVDQKSVSENWLPLGVFRLGTGDAGKVRLGDVAPERGKEIVFDAIRWSYRGAVASGGTEEPSGVPAQLRLLPNYPNPFNPSTTIRVEVPEASRIRVDVTNALGQVVAVLLDGQVSAGSREFHWNAAGLPTGVYCARLRSDRAAGQSVQRMLLVR